MGCIYKIYFNQAPENFYIGSAINFNLRKIRHRHQLKKSIHRNLHLQRLYNKCGASDLVFEIVEEVPDSTTLLEREQYWIDKYVPTVNILRIAGSAYGYRHTEEAKSRISMANRGRKMTIEQIRKGVASRVGQKTCLGIKRSDKTRRKISEARKRMILNSETGGTEMKVAPEQIIDLLKAQNERIVQLQNENAELNAQILRQQNEHCECTHRTGSWTAELCNLCGREIKEVKK